MSEERLDRIEAALDRQVAVNADLRTSVTELRPTTEALLQIATIHQQNFECLTAKLNADRVEYFPQGYLTEELHSQWQEQRSQWQEQRSQWSAQ